MKQLPITGICSAFLFSLCLNLTVIPAQGLPPVVHSPLKGPAMNVQPADAAPASRSVGKSAEHESAIGKNFNPEENSGVRSESKSASPLDWLLNPAKASTPGQSLPLDQASREQIIDRILARLVQAETREANLHLKTDYRITWITAKWAADGVHNPFVAATYRVLGVHPERVFQYITRDRQAMLGREYSRWYDSAGNLKPDVPKKNASTARPNADAKRRDA